MVNPNITKKAELTFTPTEKAKNLFKVIYREQSRSNKDNDQIPKIQVSDLISKMSFYYEKIRNTVDYNEDHLLRKNAIKEGTPVYKYDKLIIDLNKEIKLKNQKTK